MARMLRFLGAGVLLLAACHSPEEELTRRVATADVPALRHAAALIYKDAFADSTQHFASVPAAAWPKAIAALHPLRVTAQRDGIALSLLPGNDAERGLYVVPEGIAHRPADSARARFRPLREGIYLYAFGAPH